MDHFDNALLAPAIVMDAGEHRQLRLLALAGPGHTAEAADHLHWELDRATIVEGELPSGTVRLNSIVTYSANGGPPVHARLVLPAAANPAKGRISILTPIGTALIGLRPGQSIGWLRPEGGIDRVTVLEVA